LRHGSLVSMLCCLANIFFFFFFFFCKAHNFSDYYTVGSMDIIIWIILFIINIGICT
jgi:hypothetical protein